MASLEKIHYAKPSVTDLEIAYVTDAITNGWGEHCYDYITKFENAFKKYLGVEFAVATSSCTGALHLALAVLNVGYGDEIIIGDINWIASVAPVVYLGAKPVFVDVLPDSWCIDPERIEEAITPRTKAIIAVHLYGNLAEMDRIMAVARKHNLYVIEDAAEALGSEYRGKKAGSIAHFGVFSFHGTKTVSTGEGGMLVTNQEDLFKAACILANHGRNPEVKKMFFPDRIGYKYKLSNLQAAMGLAQVERVDELVSKKREIFFQYRNSLSVLPELSFNPEPPHTINSYWMPTVIFDRKLKINRDQVIKHFKDKYVDMRPFFYPLSSLPMFDKKLTNTVSYDTYERGINLPSYYDLNQENVEFICKQLRDFLKEKCRK
ncbi:MAG: DegT/DnrJ/EryC1/StrS family aminotransferase [Candidatus Abyssobacteria bacterium SURF_5]|uniref:DegT/DnrJ/EryC1/StrS family aminotransferase n=1 Tax=Abyssobacteria bacterium (strain SURF_5) TaxID=2093360 RepID=A0A3A4P9E3_ABYX5|nr:MAG: DegT/DnrJ/EryC1/StrS family aminotransferase [Candidatus Abyssubacteria bacterium SURF_5]